MEQNVLAMLASAPLTGDSFQPGKVFLIGGIAAAVIVVTIVMSFLKKDDDE